MKKLLIVLNEDISVYQKKGEIIDRYYNPNNFFDEVIFLMVGFSNEYDNKILQRLVGKAQFKVYFLEVNIKKSLILFPFGLDNIYLNNKLNKINLENIDLIRAYGMGLNFYFAHKIAKKLNKSYILSLHNQFDELKKIEKISLKKTILNYYLEKKSIKSLKEADLVIGVYSPIEKYTKKIEVKNYQTIYNVINPENITKKTDYKIKDKFRIINVGRQIIGRDISKIIQAIAEIENIEFLVIGDGEYHNKLVNLAKELNILNKKVFFKKAIPNDEICEILPTFDCYIGHSEYAEIAKSTMEAMLTGLPIVFNKREDYQVKEMEESGVILVDNKMDNYKSILLKLKNDVSFRIKKASEVYKYAMNNFDPQKIENKIVEVYKEFIQ